MLVIIINPVRLTRNLEPLARAYIWILWSETKMMHSYTNVMIHIDLAQKKSYPFKIINSCGNIFYLPEPITVNSPEFKWFGTKSISHVTEYSGKLTQENSKNIHGTL